MRLGQTGPGMFLLFLAVSLGACSEPLDRESLVGTWTHSALEERPHPDLDLIQTFRRSDVITLNEDGTYSRVFKSDFPEDSEDFTSTGTWLLRGHLLHLTPEDTGLRLDDVKGKVDLIDAYSMKLDKAFYTRQGRPRTTGPPK